MNFLVKPVLFLQQFWIPNLNPAKLAKAVIRAIISMRPTHANSVIRIALNALDHIAVAQPEIQDTSSKTTSA